MTECQKCKFFKYCEGSPWIRSADQSGCYHFVRKDKITNREYWQKKLAEAKNGEDFFYQLEQMNDEIWEKQCRQAEGSIRCLTDNCEKCKARWLDTLTEESKEIWADIPTEGNKK